MQEISTTAAFHFPRQIGLIKRLRYISFIINDITLLVSSLALLILITNFTNLKILIFQKYAVFPITPVLFILSGIVLLFGAKRHLVTTHYDADKELHPWWTFGIPIFFAEVVGFLGLVNFTNLTNGGILSLLHASLYTGFCFFLLGFALIPPYVLIPHRFHITQLLIFIVLCLNVFVILENAYQFFSPFPVQHILEVSLPTACSFVLFCSGLLFRWSNRGFLGNFTLDSTASIFALRVFVINLMSAPLIALIVLFMMQQTHFNMYVVLTVVVVCFSVISSLLLWINVKLLYSHELEHVLMRESLRSHNINLNKEQEELQKRMDQLEQEKQEYLDKLKTQSAWRNAVDRLG